MPKGNSRYDAEHLRNVSSYLRQIDEIFKAADEEAARIAKASGAEYDPDRPFSFDDYPSVRKRVDKMTSDLASRVERTIVNGIKAQWELSNRKNDDLVETVTGLKADDLPADRRRRWFGTNEPARDAFIRRETEGMNLSEEVWRFRRETEFGIDLSLKSLQDRMERGLSEGVSAADMSRELMGYLKNPDKLFRRVRDERGNLTLSRNARLFHPGQGVYRSSYMNARRLAATETNMAYRSADHERWKNLDFVVGIEIQTSNNHTTKDGRGKTVELEDICDTLAGRYPKDFKFVGWHPHCRCIATTILKTEEEMEADTERMLNGEGPLSPDTSRNYIGELPEKFTKWLDRNAERIENAKSLPYFLKDNEGLINGNGTTTPSGTTATTATATPTAVTTTFTNLTNSQMTEALRKAAERHAARTDEEIAAITQAQEIRRANQTLATAKGYDGINYSALEKAIKDNNIVEIRAQVGAVNTAIADARAKGETNLATFNDRLKNAGVTTLDVKNLKEPLSPTEITNRVGGGDLTKGSCASLALAYAGERCGYDVLDYRDGQSRVFFSMNYHDLTKAVGGLIATNRNANTAARELLGKTVKGREYILGVGKHAAVVRKGADGMEYLELQSPTTNGFKSLKTVKKMQWRFKSTNSRIVGGYKIEQEAYLIDIDILKNNKEFKKLLEYINTAENEQKKGVEGTIK